MNGKLFRSLFIVLCIFIAAGCANVMPPTGGKKDVTPPKPVSITPADSQLRTRVNKILIYFDEYITLADAANQVQISPILPIQLNVTSLNKHVLIKIPDTLLMENTTYRITFGNAIRDLNEGNILNKFSYIFSTGNYFDSLSLAGNVTNAMTGLPDSGAFVMLYDVKDNDSAVVRHKPLYVTHTASDGTYLFQGLPPRTFRIYGLHDANSNLTYDGGKEWIAFREKPITPLPDTTLNFDLRTFPEVQKPDTSYAATHKNLPVSNKKPVAIKLSYQVLTDTMDNRRRTQDIRMPLVILFSVKPTTVNLAKVYMTYDSSGTAVEATVDVTRDSTGLQMIVATDWKENNLYTLRLQKGFAKDSAGTDVLPGRWTFRTKRDEDYAKMAIHTPSKYFGRKYILQITTDKDTFYQKPILDSFINLVRVPPATYTMRIIEDLNENGFWDTGDLFGKKQPERVIPYNDKLVLKPNFEMSYDFDRVIPKKLPPPTAVIPKAPLTPGQKQEQKKGFEGR